MNQLYYGDNLDVLRDSIASESVDLIYLDPPFNSSATYNVLFKSPKGEQSTAQIEAFEDTWEWGSESERLLQQMKFRRGDLAFFLDFFVDSLGKNALSAYLIMMAARLVELHRVLKPTGSFYIHCDTTASHYLKVILDRVFDVRNFRNEITWKRQPVRGAKARSQQYARNSDRILFYSKSSVWIWNGAYKAYEKDFLKSKFRPDKNGRLFRDCDLGDYSEKSIARFEAEGRIYTTSRGKKRLIRYLDEEKGESIGDIWIDIAEVNAMAKERLGYPTQKPVALLERIIQASSNPGDIVLDPFCGCGTAVHAAQKLGRNWIGIDVTHLAISLIEKRLRDAFKDPPIQFDVIGTPKDIDGAKDLADRDKYQFQWWACSLVNAQPYGGKKKGADGGIDGQIFFDDFVGGRSTIQQIIVSVKGGANVTLTMLKDLIATVHHNKAAIGLFVTLTSPTKPMVREAAVAGFYRAGNGREYPKIQILTVEGLLAGKERPEYFDMKLGELTYKKAQRESSLSGTQQELF